MLEWSLKNGTTMEVAGISPLHLSQAVTEMASYYRHNLHTLFVLVLRNQKKAAAKNIIRRTVVKYQDKSDICLIRRRF